MLAGLMAVILGPVFAFIISVSNLSLFGFGAYFWALVIGIGISLILECDHLPAFKNNS
jgi:benzoate membrane transport protein